MSAASASKEKLAEREEEDGDRDTLAELEEEDDGDGDTLEEWEKDGDVDGDEEGVRSGDVGRWKMVRIRLKVTGRYRSGLWSRG